MSHRNPRERFDYKSWFERNVAKRTVAALEARDAEFAEKHADTPLAHLAQYVGNRAELLRHTPSPCEIDGGTFIEERFGGWAAVLEMAHLRPPIKEPKLKDTARYKREKAVQEPLFYEESERKKKAKRAKAAASHAAQQSRLKEKKRLEQEKKEARDAAARQCPAVLPFSSHDGLNGDCQLSLRVGGENPPLPPPLFVELQNQNHIQKQICYPPLRGR